MCDNSCFVTNAPRQHGGAIGSTSDAVTSSSILRIRIISWQCHIPRASSDTVYMYTFYNDGTVIVISV